MSTKNGMSTREALTRRQALGYGGAAAATAATGSLLAATPASAQDVEGDDAAELESDGGSGRRSVRLRSVSLAQANRIVAAGVRFVRDREDLPPMFILVVDVCGDEKASRRMDGNGAASVALVPAKAHTSARLPGPDHQPRGTDHRPGAGTHHSRRPASACSAADGRSSRTGRSSAPSAWAAGRRSRTTRSRRPLLGL